jgi:hypothetical protein
MKVNLNRPSAALIIASIALVAALAGGAYAASKIQTSDLAKKAVTTKKIAGKAVTSQKLADSAVTSGKLAAGERSEGFVVNTPGATPLPALAINTVQTLNLPTGGTYVVTAAASLGNNAATANLANCELRDDGVKVTAGNGALPALAVFGETITLTGTSDGGTVTLVCQLDSAGQARDRVITAVRVGTLQTQ